MASLKLDNISKRFDSTFAAQGVSFEVDRECLALLGPSGCGKSTTINMIAGFIPPDSGQILVGGKDVTAVPPYKRNTGMVFQDYALFPHKSVADNIAFGLRMRKVPRTEQEKRVNDILALTGLGRLGERYPHQISGGQRQRVALARALVIQPSILLLDEPLSNLDARLREFLRDEIRQILNRTGITAVFVTHDQAEAFAVADRVALMDGGRLVQIGTAKDLYLRPVNRFVAEFFGECNFIAGRQETAAAGVVSMDTPVGQVRIRETGAPPEATRGKNLLVAVRPEQMFIVSSEKSESINRLSGIVKRIRYLGSLSKIEVELQDHSTAKVDMQRLPEDLAVGQRIELGWAIDHGVLLDSAAA